MFGACPGASRRRLGGRVSALAEAPVPASRNAGRLARKCFDTEPATLRHTRRLMCIGGGYGGRARPRPAYRGCAFLGNPPGSGATWGARGVGVCVGGITAALTT